MENKTDRILFLDFDGVIITDRAYFTINKKIPNEPMMVIDPIGLKLIDNLCNNFDLSVVISSTWRKEYDCKTILRSHGFSAKFHKDINTPVYKEVKLSESAASVRKKEIKKWLEKHPDTNIYIIFDDLELSDFGDHFISTDFYDGISSRNYLDAISNLEAQIKKEGYTLD